METLPTPKELKTSLPLSPMGQQFIAKARDTIVDLLNQNDPRKIFIVGPCSIHDPQAAIEYAEKIKALQNEMGDAIFFVMRCYIEKPRTQIGWKGLVNDPGLNGTHKMAEGIEIARTLLLKLTELEIPIATEILDPLTVDYFDDLISWGCIGARTAESQIHRIMASGLAMPIAFKNSTDGNIQIAINGMITASKTHTLMAIDDYGKRVIKKTEGNPYCHLVLRGGCQHTNYDHVAIAGAQKTLRDHELSEIVIVDCSHGNSEGSLDGQISAFKSVIHQMIEGNTKIRGIVLESHLFGGRQEITGHPLRYGVSVTDHCLDFETTRQLIAWAYESLQGNTFKKIARIPLENFVANETIHP